MTGHAWRHPTSRKSLMLFFLGYYLYAKNLCNWLLISRDNDDERKEPCSLIGQDHILVCNLKFCELN